MAYPQENVGRLAWSNRARKLLLFLAVSCWLACPGSYRTAVASDLEELISAAQASPEQAAEVLRALREDGSLQLVPTLEAMRGQSAVIKNWILPLAQSLADESPAYARRELQQFVQRMSEDPDARYWAFQYLTDGAPEQRARMLEGMLADPCLELRYEAVELQLQRLENERSELNDDELIVRYRELLSAARLPAQVQQVARKLGDLGEQVDLLQHFGFIDQWRTVGPFNNVDQVGFDVAYDPERQYAAEQLSLDSTYEGKDGAVVWRELTTEADDGAVDLNEAYDNEKGAIVYGLATFNSPSDFDCEVRIGSPNACKVWVNNRLVISREVYHAGGQIDQYTAPVSLEQGANTVLVKICQNEQRESWAQDWTFQLRFTDSSGWAIQPAE